MKAFIEQVNRYTLTINGVKYEGFELESEWNGFAKYVGPKGTVIVSRPDVLVGDVFANIFGKSDIGCDVVKASPSLISDST